MKKRILCFGDSNTWGFTPVTAVRYDEKTRWTGILQEKLGPDYAIIEEGLSGRTTVFDVDFDDLENGKKALGYILKSQQPLDAAVVFLGTNDIVEHKMDRIELGITEIIRQIKNANYIIRSNTPIFANGAKVLLICPLAFGPTCVLPKEIVEESKLFSSAYKRVSLATGVEFLDLNGQVEASEEDGIHFTVQAHSKVANLVYDKLKEMGL
jgi:lysophospholipase L1-like esterase